MDTINLTTKEINNLNIFNKGGCEGKILLFNQSLVLKHFEMHLKDFIDFDTKQYKLERLATRKISNIAVTPRALVKVDGNFEGYLMPKISDAMHIDSIRDYNKLLIVYKKLFSDLDYLHKKNITVGDIKPSNILINSKDKTKFIDIDSMGIDEFSIDHNDYRSNEARMIPNYEEKFKNNNRQEIDYYLLLACFINSLSADNNTLIGKLFGSKLSMESKKQIYQVLNSNKWKNIDINEILESEESKIK